MRNSSFGRRGESREVFLGLLKSRDLPAVSSELTSSELCPWFSTEIITSPRQRRVGLTPELCEFGITDLRHQRNSFSGKTGQMIKYELESKSPLFVALLSGFLSLK